MEQWPFIPGRLYNRQADIHGRFGGQQQGGIATPSDAPAVFAFTGSTGAKHGYADSWQPDGSFHYCGEGQIGDMTLTRGNRAIASHSGNSRDLLLFETTGKGQPVRFVGQFVCAGWFIEPLPDREGTLRDAYIFKLVALAASSEAVSSALPDVPKTTEEFNRLRMRAYAAARKPEDVAPSTAVATFFVRSQLVRDYALARAGGSCVTNGALPEQFLRQPTFVRLLAALLRSTVRHCRHHRGVRLERLVRSGFAARLHRHNPAPWRRIGAIVIF